MYYIPQLLTNRYIRHGISTIEDKNMSYEWGERDEVRKHRKNFLTKLRIPVERSVFLQVQHGTKIIEGSSSLAGIGYFSSEAAIKADAIVTKEKGLAMVILTADCIPAIFYDRANEIVCLAHISRKNSMLSFSQVIVSHLKRTFNTNPQDLRVFFGPSIKKKSYIIPEFPEGFDLIEENTSQLVLKGVRRENIVEDSIDTASQEEFFSHYRDVRAGEKEGRFATVVMLT